ncbi:unnamed protein product [Zymoseptoria tritici ST99CH_3D1]|nr:unnamed protein product [Zymoseptoria tritici ST99CH_3D1]
MPLEAATFRCTPDFRMVSTARFVDTRDALIIVNFLFLDFLLLLFNNGPTIAYIKYQLKAIFYHILRSVLSLSRQNLPAIVAFFIMHKYLHVLLLCLLASALALARPAATAPSITTNLSTATETATRTVIDLVACPANFPAPALHSAPTSPATCTSTSTDGTQHHANDRQTQPLVITFDPELRSSIIDLSLDIRSFHANAEPS